ncbi:MAG: hypothetical protein OHK0011_25330 [Turneriella sp.]
MALREGSGWRVLEQGMRQLVKSPQVVHAAYNVSKLFHDATMRFAERQRWHDLLLEAMQQPKRKLQMLFVVVPETRLATGHPVHGNVDAKLAEADLQELLFNFRYFASAFQALTGIGWDYKIIRHTGAVTKTTYVADPPRSVMHPIMESITPAFNANTQREIEQSDAVTLVWAGTRQPPGHLITNGSGTEWDFYRETFTKRFMPEDALARFEWRSNHEGFYNRKVRGK